MTKCPKRGPETGSEAGPRVGAQERGPGSVRRVETPGPSVWAKGWSPGLKYLGPTDASPKGHWSCPTLSLSRARRPAIKQTYSRPGGVHRRCLLRSGRALAARDSSLKCHHRCRFCNRFDNEAGEKAGDHDRHRQPSPRNRSSKRPHNGVYLRHLPRCS